MYFVVFNFTYVFSIDVTFSYDHWMEYNRSHISENYMCIEIILYVHVFRFMIAYITFESHHSYRKSSGLVRIFCCSIKQVDIVPLVSSSRLSVLNASQNNIAVLYSTVEVLKDLRKLQNLFLHVSFTNLLKVSYRK